MAEAQLTAAQDIQKMEAQFKAALPAHVSEAKFVRVVMTAINGNSELQNADRRSLLEAAMKCAQDGLIPDGREAAFVVFNTNVGTKQNPQWIKKAQYMPMVWGIVKKVRNSGELGTLMSQVVYENDHFDYELGDDERIIHKPVLSEPGKPIAAYAIAKTKDGDIYREVMARDEIMAVKEISKAKDSGPWAGPFEMEMWKKTVIKRLCKRLPLSAEVEAVVNRDDEFYDLKKARDVTDEGERKELPPIPHKINEAKRKKFFTACIKIPPDKVLEHLATFAYTSTHEILDDKFEELMKWASEWKPEETKPEQRFPIEDDLNLIPDFKVPDANDH